MERDTGIIKERDYIVKTDRNERMANGIDTIQFLLGGIFMQQNKKVIRR